MNPMSMDNFILHELIGLSAGVAHSSNPYDLGLRGKIVDETKNTLLIFDGVKKRMIPKDTAIFSFILPDKSITEVDGKKIIGRPDERIKNVRRK
ncbi:MAG: ribonuclease protein subunit [Thermoproteota archaeon]|nr:ribonuclease protein subunit [Thermoproteota archaeon]